MCAMSDDTERTIARAVELAEELSRLIQSLRAVAPSTEQEVVDLRTLHHLADDLGDTAEVVALVTSYGNGLPTRVGQYFAAVEAGDEAGACRMLIDLRSSSELLGAPAVAAWCRRRAAGDSAPAAELHDVVARTRRELTVWRLTTTDPAVTRN